VTSVLLKDVQLDGETTHVYVSGNRIEEIGKKREADTVLECKGKVALPGMVNLHTHAAMALFRGFADDVRLQDWLERKIWPREAKMTPDDVYWGTKLACLEMIKTGTTTFNDMYFHMDHAAKAVKEMGLRGFLAEGFIDLGIASRAKEQFKQVDEVNRKIEGMKLERITPVLGPHAIYTVSEDSWRRFGDLADKKGYMTHTHLSETKREVEECAARYGARGVGIDIDPLPLIQARANARRAGVIERVTFKRGDLFEADLRPATVVTLYLFTEINRRLLPKLRSELAPGSRIVSHKFDMGEDWAPERTVRVGDSVIHLWTVPPR